MVPNKQDFISDENLFSIFKLKFGCMDTIKSMKQRSGASKIPHPKPNNIKIETNNAQKTKGSESLHVMLIESNISDLLVAKYEN